MEQECAYGFGRTVAAPFAATVGKVREALQAQGFGILSEIDVAAKLKEKLGVDFPPYLILGACNPRLAHQALQAEINLGLLLPCNVVVYREEPERTVVMAMDPEAALGLVGNPAVAAIATQVKGLLEKALAAL
ncbi:MAG: DUF302 domain-containing protein [Desulfuromonadales bacterium]|nr:DUF302 domain-containing protein [Desulfuromonadales bacterium]